MWSNKSELESELRKAGLGEWATKLADAARQCVILLPGPTEQGTAAPVGASRLGGEPDLPPDVDWPTRPPMRREGGDRQSMPARVLFGASHWLHRFRRSPAWARASQAWEREQQAQRQRRERAWPLSFVAQIDFAELHAVHALHGFPPAGRLLLFCDGVDLPWGAAEEQAHARVVFTELPPEGLQRRRQPPEFEAARVAKLRDEFAFKPRSLRPFAWLQPPPLGSPEFIHLAAEHPRAWAATEPAGPAYQQFWTDLQVRYPQIFGERGAEMIHQVGGFAHAIQDPVEAECVKFTAEHPRPKSWWRNDPLMQAATMEHLARAREWQLVLQIDSDDKAGMQWGDVGRLYLCARQGDLAACRFDRCWTIAQCY